MQDTEFTQFDDDLYALIRNYVPDDVEIVSDEYFEVRNKGSQLIERLRNENTSTED